MASPAYKPDSPAVILLAVAIAFLIAALILQLAYNYAVPRLIKSANKEYDVVADFTPISYGTAAVVLILCGLVFGTSASGVAVSRANCK